MGPNQKGYKALTNDANYSSRLVAFKRQATFDHFDRVLDKNNKGNLCCAGPDTELWELQVNFLAIILNQTLQTEQGRSLTTRYRDDPRRLRSKAFVLSTVI